MSARWRCVINPSLQAKKVCDFSRSRTKYKTVHKIKEHGSGQTEIVIDYKESSKITKTYVAYSSLSVNKRVLPSWEEL